MQQYWTPPPQKKLLQQYGIHDLKNYWVGLAEVVANITNRTRPHGCWVCATGPTNGHEGIPLLPIPVNSIGLVAPKLWEDPNVIRSNQKVQ